MKESYEVSSEKLSAVWMRKMEAKSYAVYRAGKASVTPEVTVPTEITLSEREQLKEMGYSKSSIEKMTPTEAYKIFGKPLPIEYTGLGAVKPVP